MGPATLIFPPLPLPGIAAHGSIHLVATIRDVVTKGAWVVIGASIIIWPGIWCRPIRHRHTPRLIALVNRVLGRDNRIVHTGHSSGSLMILPVPAVWNPEGTIDIVVGYLHMGGPIGPSIRAARPGLLIHRPEVVRIIESSPWVPAIGNGRCGSVVGWRLRNASMVRPLVTIAGSIIANLPRRRASGGAVGLSVITPPPGSETIGFLMPLSSVIAAPYLWIRPWCHTLSRLRRQGGATGRLNRLIRNWAPCKTARIVSLHCGGRRYQHNVEDPGNQ
jgi:hypothetical protein